MENKMRFLILLVLMCSMLSGQSPEAVFSFVEDGTYATVKAGERKIVDIETVNGIAQFEIGFIKIPRSTPGVRAHWNIYGRNFGGHGLSNTPDQAVHPISIKVSFFRTGNLETTDVLLDRNNRHMGHVNIPSKGLTYGLRDAWLQEPTRIVTSPDNGGTITFYLLDNREPENGYPKYFGRFGSSEQSNDPTADPLSYNHHRWKGGFMKVWDVIVTDSNASQYIEHDPMPKEVPDRWYLLVRHARPEWRSEYPVRVKEVIKTLDELNFSSHGALSDPPGEHTLLWWIFQAENRFRYWSASNEYMDIGNQSHQTGWKDWLCLKWQEGHYNNGYNWLSIVFRRWLDTRSEASWWIVQRMARWEATSGICWSGTYDNQNLRFIPSREAGSDWYEKGVAGFEVGSSFRPSNYKNYSEQILLANLVLKTPLSQEAVNLHGDYVMNRARYDTWDGLYGSRIAGWGMMNAMAFYRFTEKKEWLLFAMDVADNAISIMCEVQRLNAEPDVRWRDTEIGVPYVSNYAMNGSKEFSPWQAAKIAIGLTEISAYGGVKKYDRKIKQMSEFLVEECMYTFGDTVMSISRSSSDRIPAQYYNGMGNGEVGYPVDTTVIDWHVWPIAYTAAYIGSDICGNQIERMVGQMGQKLDQSIPVRAIKYEIGRGLKVGNIVRTLGIDLDGVTTRHNLRLEADSGQAFMFHIDRIEGLRLIVRQYYPVGQVCADDNYIATIIGPIGEDKVDPTYFVRSTSDRAIRRFEADPPIVDFSRPFDWSAGKHFNNWQKMVAKTLTQGSGPLVALKTFLINKEKKALRKIAGQK